MSASEITRAVEDPIEDLTTNTIGTLRVLNACVENGVQRVVLASSAGCYGQAVSIPQDREIVHVLPQEFVLDDQHGIANPVGMTGNRLEANVHIVTAATTSVQNLVTCVNRAGVMVRDTVLEQVAAAEAVLTPDERELGVAFIDVGGGTTDLAIFEKGSIWHTAVLPAGGDHFTNDLADPCGSRNACRNPAR